ncbi:MAG TPA: L,D-transpeptidase [Xanthobacteraceae bacterium]|nr:L,D-transpeptidase [Xanthobacteraceae bacterium]
MKRILGACALGLAAVGTAGPPTPAAARGELVAFRSEAPGGSIVVRTQERRLYYVLGGGRALRYPVGVGRPGRQWSGATRILGKYRRPAWSPPPEIRRDKPSLPEIIPGGSPRNPMGDAALTVRDGTYAIHGTNAPNSIGRFVSYGCIRMYNSDILDLFDRVSVGTPVFVTR